jgi:hypothetical protein
VERRHLTTLDKNLLHYNKAEIVLAVKEWIAKMPENQKRFLSSIQTELTGIVQNNESDQYNRKIAQLFSEILESV